MTDNMHMPGKPKNKGPVRTTALSGGFTLIETLVAVMILATSIAGPLSIASRSLNSSLIAKDQITAFFLAGDAIEYVRFVRDTNRLLGADWLTGAGTTPGTDLTPCQDPAGCYVDTTGNSYTDTNSNTPDIPVTCPASPSPCPVMNYNTTYSRFTYEPADTAIVRSPFTRKITLTSISASEQQLVVTVSWKDMGSSTRSINVTENIFGWQ